MRVFTILLPSGFKMQCEELPSNEVRFHYPDGGVYEYPKDAFDREFGAFPEICSPPHDSAQCKRCHPTQ